ncbi:ribonuclease J [Labrys wisconsinensis]|uniref:Ribonuclease J n=1 Tax=Labrys wisconsinensis TaxID=425677 RepID=A0ABU0J3P5_9HYPH|nr:ribonuclease J [Labrys wisconsinensis]MDQ0468888.1 ribonuclease J [Labrys wisconsinensis]
MARDTSELVFCALGGIGEIGMNMALYGYGPPKKRQWLMVDCGVSFAGEDVPGVDLVMPDVRFIEAERRNLVGIVLTHAHEDHFGALIHLWPRLEVPVYATRFSAALLEAKRLAEPGAPRIDVRVIPSRHRFTAGAFDIELIDVAHSIPESNALAIRTPAGTVIHTGDWKIDETPVIPPLTDGARLKAIGDEGVLALVCDSTNAIREGRSPSERDVARSLAEIIATKKGRVAVTTFASNVGRIRSVAEAAMANDRSVIIVGRAMERVCTVARECGLLDGIPPFLSPENYGYMPREKVVAVLTGSQGEPRAALARIARDEHPDVTLAKGDTVVFSSRTIPGNEKAVGGIINGLVRQGVEIVTDRTHLVHVSGHPRRDELADMYGWVRPKIAIPVHGEAWHLSEHAGLARSLGVPDVITAKDGDIVRLAPGPAQAVATAPVAKVYLDGEILVHSSEETVPQRRRLAWSGAVSIALALSEKGEIVSEPDVKTAGLPLRSRDGRDMEDLIADAALAVLESLPRPKRRDPDAVEIAIERGVRSTVNSLWGKKPVCQVIVLVV